jgi:hypothetical protein
MRNRSLVQLVLEERYIAHLVLTVFRTAEIVQVPYFATVDTERNRQFNYDHVHKQT